MHIALVSIPQHESLVDLLCELNRHYHPASVIPREVVRTHLLDNLLGAASPVRLVVAAREDGRVAGLAAIMLLHSLVEPSPDASGHCHLKELFVRASDRGQGVGGALMAWIAAHAVQNRCRRIDWPVNAANPRGIAFYERLGAKRVAERLSYRLSGEGLDWLARGG